VPSAGTTASTWTVNEPTADNRQPVVAGLEAVDRDRVLLPWKLLGRRLRPSPAGTKLSM
jgi:hypothetical protein